MDYSHLISITKDLSIFGYLIIAALAFFESFAFIGLIVPGSIAVMIGGFLAAEGVMDVGDLFIFSAIAAILGDSLSYYLGTKGVISFRKGNKIFKPELLTKGEQYFNKHGAKSVLGGRFIGWIRSIIPFVAGLFKLDRKIFLFWNVLSGLLWAVSHILVGYFFGGALNIITAWTTRAGFFVFVAVVSIFALWFLIKQSKPIFSFILSIAVSVKNAVISNSDVQKLIARHPHIFAFLKRRFDREKFSGLPLTLILSAFIYVASLFFGIVEDVMTSDQIVAADIRVMNLLYAFRDMELITFFTWITLLGKWQIVFGGVIVATIILWMWRRRIYIFPFWGTLIGSEIFNLLAKLAFRRPRPEIAYYIKHGFSFPSGHATIAVAFYGFLTYILLRETKKWRHKATILFWGLVLILAIGLSRLYLGVHYVSDVWGGYLSGSLLLIIGIALAEWVKHRRLAPTLFFVSRKVKIVSGVLVAALVGFYALFVFQYHPPLNTSHNEQLIVVENVFAPFKEGKIPQFTETLLGNNQEPLNFIVVAKNDAKFVDAMNAAGWLLADKATVVSIFTLAKSAITNKGYPTAPMTPSFWNTKVHDFGFEKETLAQNVKERHHARFWETNLQTKDGKLVYVGTVSFDNGIKWLVTHKISPDIDTEREILFSDLQKTGLVATENLETFVTPVLGKNFSGDQFFTDGKVYLVVL